MNLPPIGTHVVVCDDGSLVYGHGESGEVLAHVDGTAVIRMSYGLGCFLPRCLRTPEQIKSEEREAGIQALKLIFDSCSDELMPTSNKYLDTLFGAIHDAGYRKQVES